MSTLKLRGIVIKEENSGESGKKITILAKDAGKLLLSARGARNAKSKFMASSQIFAYSDFLVFEGKGFLSITQSEVIESFYPLRENIENLYASAYFADIIERTTPVGIEANDTIKLLLKSFMTLSKAEVSVFFVYVIFKLKYLCLLGFMPDIFECKKCKKTLSDVYFDSSGDFLCENCGGGKRISKAALSALSYIFSAEIKNLYSFKVTNEILVELEEISCILYLMYVDEKIKSEEFLRELLGIGSKV